jgi:hypothetical protein
MKKKNPNNTPIFYKNKEDLDKPLYDLMEELRTDVHHVRGKLHDIRSTYGWDDRILHLEGGLTCLLVAMHAIAIEWKEFEKKHNV